jgi:hypothetical protein
VLPQPRPDHAVDLAQMAGVAELMTGVDGHDRAGQRQGRARGGCRRTLGGDRLGCRGG